MRVRRIICNAPIIIQEFFDRRRKNETMPPYLKNKQQSPNFSQVNPSQRRLKNLQESRTTENPRLNVTTENATLRVTGGRKATGPVDSCLMFLGSVIGGRGIIYSGSSLWPCQKHYLKI